MTNSMKTRGLSCEGKTCSLSTFLRGLLWSPQVSALWSLAGKPWACLYEYVWGLGEDSKYWFPAWAGKATSSAPPYTSRVLTHVYAPHPRLNAPTWMHESCIPSHNSSFKHWQSFSNLYVVVLLRLVNSAGPSKCHLKCCCPVLVNCFPLWLYATEC